MKNAQNRLSMRSSVGSGSLSNVNAAANHLGGSANQMAGYQPYQDWHFNQQMPPRSNSVDPYQMMTGSSSSLSAQQGLYMPQQFRDIHYVLNLFEL